MSGTMIVWRQHHQFGDGRSYAVELLNEAGEGVQSWSCPNASSLVRSIRTLIESPSAVLDALHKPGDTWRGRIGLT